MMSQREENMIYGYRNKVKKSFRFLLYFRILKCIKQKSMFFIIVLQWCTSWFFLACNK